MAPSSAASLSVPNEDIMKVGESREISVDKIVPNPNQPRRVFDENDLQELAYSIRSNGLIQPIIVRPLEEPADTFELVAGERRWRACQLLQLPTIAAIVKERSMEDSAEIALVENLQRTDLAFSEEARALQALTARYDWNNDLVAERVGRSAAYVKGRIELLELPDEVLALLDAKKITLAHIAVIRKITDRAKQIEAATLAANRGLSPQRLRGRMQRFMEATKGSSSTPAVKYEQITHGIVTLFDSMSRFGFNGLRDLGKRELLANQLTTLKERIDVVVEELRTPVENTDDELPPVETVEN